MSLHVTSLSDGQGLELFPMLYASDALLVATAAGPRCVRDRAAGSLQALWDGHRPQLHSQVQLCLRGF